METKYDILVIGSDIPGLVSAALLAKNGFRVAVVAGKGTPAVYEKDRYRFNDALFFVTGLEDGPLKSVCDEIGLTVPFPAKGVSFQVVLPDERINVYRDSERFDEELKRCFPDDAGKLTAFYQQIADVNGRLKQIMDLNPFSFRPVLPLNIFMGKRSVNGVIKGMGLNQRSQAFINAQLRAFSNLDGPLSFVAASSLLESSRKGVYSIDGGMEGLRELLLGRIKALGGDIVRSVAKEASKNGNRWLIRTKEEAISGRIIIGSMDAASFCGLFLDIGGKFLKKSEKIRRSSRLLTVHLGVKDSGVPVGMADNLLLFRSYEREASGGNLLHIQMTPSGKGKRGMSVGCHISVERSGKDEVREATEGMLEGLERLCPFIDRHVEVLDVVDSGRTEGGLYSANLGQKMGVGVLPHEVVKGEVFFAGAEVFPGLGFDGLIYSGELAARGVLSSLEKEKKGAI